MRARAEQDAQHGNGNRAIRCRAVERQTEHGEIIVLTAEHRILLTLAAADTLLSQRRVRERADTRHQIVGTNQARLLREGRVQRDAGGGYRIGGATTTQRPAASGGDRPDDPRFPVPPIPRVSGEPLAGTTPPATMTGPGHSPGQPAGARPATTRPHRTVPGQAPAGDRPRHDTAERGRKPAPGYRIFQLLTRKRPQAGPPLTG